MVKKTMINLLVFLCVCLIPVYGVFAAEVIKNNKKGIPDKGLYQSILKELGKKPKEKFTKGEAAKIKSLSTSTKIKIKNLKGIKYLKGGLRGTWLEKSQRYSEP